MVPERWKRWSGCPALPRKRRRGARLPRRLRSARRWYRGQDVIPSTSGCIVTNCDFCVLCPLGSRRLGRFGSLGESCRGRGSTLCSSVSSTSSRVVSRPSSPTWCSDGCGGQSSTSSVVAGCSRTTTLNATRSPSPQPCRCTKGAKGGRRHRQRGSRARGEPLLGRCLASPSYRRGRRMNAAASAVPSRLARSASALNDLLRSSGMISVVLGSLSGMSIRYSSLAHQP